MAIQGEGFFQVLLPSGVERFTRDGAFRLNADGSLVTMDGNLLSDQVTIPQGASNINVGRDGTVSFTDENGAAQTAGSIQLAKFANPAGLSSEGGNLYSKTVSSGEPILNQPGISGTGTLIGGQTGAIQRRGRNGTNFPDHSATSL